MCEVGVRHAQRPGTSIMISEDGIFEAMPFDLSHAVVHSYKHLGEEIADDVAEAFTTHIASILDRIFETPEHVDSPVFTYTVGMEPPPYEAPADRIARLEEALAGHTAEDTPEDVKGQAISILVKQAERAKNNKNLDKAILLLDTAIEQYEESAQPGGGEAGSAKEVLLYQRKALLTYKRSQKNPSDDEEKHQAAIGDLHAAMEVFSQADPPDRSNDPETPGLAGAMNKRLRERTNDERFLDLSILYYERGFYIAQGYYTGINVAFMYSVKAVELLDTDFFLATLNYGHAQLLRKKVAEVCEAMRACDDWASRGDRVWVLLTMAEAYEASGQPAEAKRVLTEAEAVATATDQSFAMDKLQSMTDRFEARRGAGAGSPTPVSSTTARATFVTEDRAKSQGVPAGSIIIDLGNSAQPKRIALDIEGEY
jgi:hypothetical protein